MSDPEEKNNLVDSAATKISFYRSNDANVIDFTKENLDVLNGQAILTNNGDLLTRNNNIQLPDGSVKSIDFVLAHNQDPRESDMLFTMSQTIDEKAKNEERLEKVQQADTNQKKINLFYEQSIKPLVQRAKSKIESTKGIIEDIIEEPNKLKIKQVRKNFLENLQEQPFGLEVYEYESTNLSWLGRPDKKPEDSKNEEDKKEKPKPVESPMKFHLIHIPIIVMKEWAEVLKIKKPIRKDVITLIESIVQSPNQDFTVEGAKNSGTSILNKNPYLTKVVLEFIEKDKIQKTNLKACKERDYVNAAATRLDKNDHIQFGLDKVYHHDETLSIFRKITPAWMKTNYGKKVDENGYQVFLEYRNEIPELLWETNPSHPSFFSPSDKAEVINHILNSCSYDEQGVDGNIFDDTEVGVLRLLTNRPPVFQSAYCLHDSDLPKRSRLSGIDYLRSLTCFRKETMVKGRSNCMPQPLRIENRASFVRKKYRFPTFEDLETSGAQYRKFKSKAKRAGKTIQEYYEQDKIKFEKREDERANRADWKGGEWKPADRARGSKLQFYGQIFPCRSVSGSRMVLLRTL